MVPPTTHSKPDSFGYWFLYTRTHTYVYVATALAMERVVWAYDKKCIAWVIGAYHVYDHVGIIRTHVWDFREMHWGSSDIDRHFSCRPVRNSCYWWKMFALILTPGNQHSGWITFCSTRLATMLIIGKWNFHQIWQPIENWFVKLTPIARSHRCAQGAISTVGTLGTVTYVTVPTTWRTPNRVRNNNGHWGIMLHVRGYFHIGINSLDCCEYSWGAR